MKKTEISDEIKISGTIDGVVDENSVSSLFSLKIFKQFKNLKKDVFLSNARPITEFLFPQFFSKPTSGSQALVRFQRNLRYFFVNYLFFIVAFTALWLLTKPITLIILVVLARAYFYLKNEIKFQAFGKKLKQSYQSHVVNFVFLLLVIYFVGPVAFSSFTFAGILITVHAIMFEKGEGEELGKLADDYLFADVDDEFPGV